MFVTNFNHFNGFGFDSIKVDVLVSNIVDSVPYSMIYEQWECWVLSSLAAYAERLSDEERVIFVEESNNQGFELKLRRKTATNTATTRCLYDPEKGDIPF